MLLTGAPRTLAQEPPVAPRADEIVVYGRAIPQIGVAESGSEGVVGYADFEDKPIARVTPSRAISPLPGRRLSPPAHGSMRRSRK
ncbi:MAG: hypothetical protein LC648_00025 [Novosphingobium sp.]|nr:hypothetical protein [Novosphingobium sp.]